MNFLAFQGFSTKYHSNVRGAIFRTFSRCLLFQSMQIFRAKFALLKKANKFSSNNLLGSKYRNKLLSDNLLCPNSNSGVFDRSKFQCVKNPYVRANSQSTQPILGATNSFNLTRLFCKESPVVVAL